MPQLGYVLKRYVFLNVYFFYKSRGYIAVGKFDRDSMYINVLIRLQIHVYRQNAAIHIHCMYQR